MKRRRGGVWGGGKRRRKYTPGCRYKCAAAPISAIAGRDSLWSVKRNLFDSGRLNNNRWIGDEGLGCFLEVNQSRPLLRYPPAAHAAAPGTSLLCLALRSPPIHMSGPHSRPLITPAILGATGAAWSGEFSRQPASKEGGEDFFAAFGVPAPAHYQHHPSLRVDVIPASAGHLYHPRAQLPWETKTCIFFFALKCLDCYIGSSLPCAFLFFFNYFLEQNQREKGRSLRLLISPFNGPDISEALLHFVLTAGVLTSNGTLGRLLD